MRVPRIFVSKVIDSGRITIPRDVREVLEIEDGDYVHVSVEKLDLFRMSIHRLYAPKRMEQRVKRQASSTELKRRR